jgi:Zn-dependent M28 family amino/carboxypeptidase
MGFGRDLTRACGVRRFGLSRLWIGVAALFLGPAAGCASPADTSLARLQHDTEVLSSDAFEGRAPLSAGEDKTVAYLVEMMKRAGLQPGFPGGFVQPVPMLQVETLTKTPPRLVVAAPGGAVDFAYQRDVTLNTRRETASIDLKRSEVVFVGYGVNAPERQWNDYAGVDVRGKTVLILINDPDWRQPLGKGPFGGAAMTYYGRWTYKYEEAARQGAAAAIIVHSDASAGYPFSVPVSSLGRARVSLAPADGGAGLLAVEAWMTHAAAARLVAAAGQDLAALEAAAQTPGFRARSLGVTADIAFQVKTRRGLSRNVAGRIAGAERPGEAVIYTAHWDHLGRCPPDRTGDDICNGAIDNATGVAGLLELARRFKEARPRRSVLFLATTGEEYGLLGSEYYVAHPAFPLARTVAEIDMDPLNFMLGRTRDISLVADQTELADVVAQAAAAQGRVVTPDSAPQLGDRYRSDTLSFARAGAPVVLLGNGVDAVGRPPGAAAARLADYYDHRYHQPSDAYDPSWDWSGALQDLELDLDIGRRLADGTAWPNWYPHDEFRAARDGVLHAAGPALKSPRR